MERADAGVARRGRGGADDGPTGEVRVYRGRAGGRDADRAATRAMLDRAGVGDGDGDGDGGAGVRAWAPARQVAFGRRDARAGGYAAARAAAEARGFPAVERDVGGRAVAYTGTTVAFAHAIPLADARRGVTARYDAATATVREALATLGVDARPGEPPDAFCPGAHSLRARGKVAGVAQRVGAEAALVAGVVVVDGVAAVADVLEPVYAALGVPFDPTTVGSVAAAGGPADPDVVARALERALVGGRRAVVRPAAALAGAAGDREL
jgi:lipoate-protein ligase A